MTTAKCIIAVPKDTTRTWRHPFSIFRRSRVSICLSILLVLIYFGHVVVLADSAASRTDFKIPPPPPPPPRPGVVLTTHGETGIAHDIPATLPPKANQGHQKTNDIVDGFKTIPPPPPPRTLLEPANNLYEHDVAHLSSPPTPARESDLTHSDESIIDPAMNLNDTRAKVVCEPHTFDCTIEVNLSDGDITSFNARLNNTCQDDAKQNAQETERDNRRDNLQNSNIERSAPVGQTEMEWKGITEQMSRAVHGKGSSPSTPQGYRFRQSLQSPSIPDSQHLEHQAQYSQGPVETRQYIRPLGQSSPHEKVYYRQPSGHSSQSVVIGKDQRLEQQWKEGRPPPRYVEPSPMTSAWKSIWGKVEKSLDTLAGLEDAVGGRAQQLLSTVSLGRGRTVSSTVESSRRSSQVQRSMKMMPSNTEPLAPYGNKFEVAKKKQEEKNQAATATGRIIRANGGASSPDGQQPLPPSIQHAASGVEDPLFYATPHGAGMGETNQPVMHGSPYTNNLYMQSSSLKTPPKKPASGIDHARESRIPWDSSSTSSYPIAKPASTGPLPRPRPDYEIDQVGLVSKLSRVLSSISSIPNPAKLFRFGSKSYDYASRGAWDVDDEDEKGGFLGFFRRKQHGSTLLPQSAARPTGKTVETLAAPLKSMMKRCDDGKTVSLLSASDETLCRTMGRYQAFFDGLCILCVLVGIQQTDGFNLIKLPLSLEEFVSKTLPLASSYLRESLSTWAPIFAGYAYLAHYINRSILNSRTENLANSVGLAVQDESQYAQLYLRLTAAVGIDPSLPSNLRDAAASQVYSLVSMARLNAFVAMLLVALTLMTVTIIRPIFTALGRSIYDLFFLEELRSWPVAWLSLGNSVGVVFQSLFKSLQDLTAGGLHTFLDNPVQFSFQLSIFASSVLIALIPHIERRRKIDLKDEEELPPPSSGDTAQQFAKLGSSSATRLTMLSENGSIESALERWRNSRYVSTEDTSKGALALAFRSLGYKFLVAMVATLPIAVAYLVGMSSRQGMAHIGLQWDSLVDVSIVLGGVYMVASNAIENAVTSTRSRQSIHSFVSTLSTTIDEIKENNRRQADIQFMASVSPTAGLVVRDLWAAHTIKRAWAVRGATFQCRNGEILAVLGDDGAGKSRLLTTIAEALLSPPRRSLTSNKVRGFVGIGGVESSKWDKSVLRRRLGVLLSDIRTVADAANLYSGCSMEEILEPVDSARVSDGVHKLGASERSSILVALKVRVSL